MAITLAVLRTMRAKGTDPNTLLDLWEVELAAQEEKILCVREQARQRMIRVREHREHREKTSKNNGRVTRTVSEPSLSILSKKEREKRGKRIEPDWTLPETDRAWAAKEGLTATEINGQAARFRNYWLGQAGAKGVKLDWSATWRNWCLGFLERLGRHPEAAKPQQKAQWLIEAEEKERERLRREADQGDLLAERPQVHSGPRQRNGHSAGQRGMESLGSILRTVGMAPFGDG